MRPWLLAESCLGTPRSWGRRLTQRRLVRRLLLLIRLRGRLFPILGPAGLSRRTGRLALADHRVVRAHVAVRTHGRYRGEHVAHFQRLPGHGTRCIAGAVRSQTGEVGGSRGAARPVGLPVGAGGGRIRGFELRDHLWRRHTHVTWRHVLTATKRDRSRRRWQLEPTNQRTSNPRAVCQVETSGPAAGAWCDSRHVTVERAGGVPRGRRCASRPRARRRPSPSAGFR